MVALVTPLYVRGSSGNMVALKYAVLLLVIRNDVNAARWKSEYCLQPPSYGTCKGRIASWYYDPGIENCKMFYYSGCGENKNRFSSEGWCQWYCLQTKCGRMFAAVGNMVRSAMAERSDGTLITRTTYAVNLRTGTVDWCLTGSTLVSNASGDAVILIPMFPALCLMAKRKGNGLTPLTALR
nr:tissue factor pathway inhibitor 2-like isoform X1 [Dermacentor andersoni]